MKIKPIHAWKISVRDAPRLQEKLAAKIKTRGGGKSPQFVAGADISYSSKTSTAYAGIVLLAFPSLDLIETFTLKDSIRFPYVPGLLSFREAPLLLKLFKQVRPDPDLIFLDGHGLAHPRKFGLACHLGLFLDRATIGCAKKRLVGKFADPPHGKGSTSPLLDKQNIELGAVVRTREGCKPVFVSIGHKIALANAVRRTLECTTRYRIPEPTRLAHNLVTQFRKSHEEKPIQS